MTQPIASPTLALTLAGFCSGFSAAELPPGFAEKAKAHITDTLACGIGGACSAEAQAVLTMLEALGEEGAAPAWGTPVGLSARSAAFCNGVASHSFELDDTMGCDHSGAVVLPAALAALSRASHPVEGADFIAAVVLGYEVAKRVMEALGGYWPHNEAGWHSTATCGTFGAAVAASRILRLTQGETASALGHAASFSGGLWAFIHDASQTKRIHAGRASEGGLTAALLAQAGVSGPKYLFEDVWGSFLRAFAPGGHDAARLLRGLGEEWEFACAAIKPYASCRGTHSTMDALTALMHEHAVEPAEIASICVSLPVGLYEMCGGRDLSNLASAQMSLPFAVASFLEHGGLGIAAFSEGNRAATRVRDLMKLVELEADPGLASLAEPNVTLRCRSGASFTLSVDPPLGSPGNPLSAAQLRSKAADLMGMALDHDSTESLLERLAGLEQWSDVRELPGLLAAKRRPRLFR
jgi:2-methylcitrate dehydratase PrpD